MINTSATRSMASTGGRDRRRRGDGGLVRAFFLALVLAAVVLLALAATLAARLRPPDAPRPETAGGATSSPVDGRGGPPSLPYPNGPLHDAKYARDRVYCMVPYVWDREFYDAIMDTWGKRCDAIHFLTDAIVGVAGRKQKPHWEFPTGTFPANVHFLNMTRPWTGCGTDAKTGKPKLCRHIWEKMWKSWIYVAEHHLDAAEWFCKVDYDTFFFPENLQRYVRADARDWDPRRQHRYFGTVLRHVPGRPPMVAGAAACWSRRTLAAAAEVYRRMPKGRAGDERGRCEDRAGATEEKSTSLCLKDELNVSATPMVDDRMREHIMIDPYHNMLTWNRTKQGEWWFWKNKPANAGQMEDCCSPQPVGIHKYKRAEQIKALDQQFYGPPENAEVKRLRGATRRYVDRVRAAMGIDALWKEKQRWRS